MNIGEAGMLVGFGAISIWATDAGYLVAAWWLQKGRRGGVVREWEHKLLHIVNERRRKHHLGPVAMRQPLKEPELFHHKMPQHYQRLARRRIINAGRKGSDGAPTSE